jgi:5-methylcytosine-specific restriction endonuclease McrA
MSTFAPETYEEARERFKPMKRGNLTRRSDSAGKPLQRTAIARKRPSSTIPYATNSLRARKKKGKKRTKVPTRKKLIKTIDNLVFQIVCLMYPGCVECGSTEQPTTGHVLSRRSMATRWDFRNVFRQCWPHNYRAAMTAAGAYHLWYVKKFGIEAFEKLYQDWAKGHKYTRLELQNLVPEFESKLNELQKEQP